MVEYAKCSAWDVTTSEHQAYVLAGYLQELLKKRPFEISRDWEDIIDDKIYLIKEDIFCEPISESEAMELKTEEYSLPGYAICKVQKVRDAEKLSREMTDLWREYRRKKREMTNEEKKEVLEKIQSIASEISEILSRECFPGEYEEEEITVKEEIETPYERRYRPL